MEFVKNINTYYQRIISLIIELHHKDFSNTAPGHCMKITGLGKNELELLWDQLNEKYKGLASFIVSETAIEDNRFISATKLIELRNQQNSPLLVLIPSNSRTAAEDSYGNATFKEISLEHIEKRLGEHLLGNIPDSYDSLIKSDILGYLNLNNIGSTKVIRYLIKLEEVGYNQNSIGANLYLLGLIPDDTLLNEPEKLRSRLNFNRDSIELLGEFGKPLYDRIRELPLEHDSLQKEIVDFLKKEKEAKTRDEICELIHTSYTHLNFKNWLIPDLDFTHIKLFTEDLTSNDFRIEEGRKTLKVIEGKASKLKVRFRTQPAPKEIQDLKYFKVILMAVDGANGEEISVVRKLKNTASNRPYRDATIELNSNMIEEGSYFFKVLAEDEYGNILNQDDEFKDEKVQKQWEEVKSEKSKKSDFPYKLTCDSEDFDFHIEDAVEVDDNQRKDKLNNVLQAYFKFRIEKLKKEEEPSIPTNSETTNKWITDDKKLTSIFHINYSEKHNYQVIISSKLREIESLFLENSGVIGYIEATLKSSASAIGFESLLFVEGHLNDIVPKEISQLRKAIFERIKNSNEEENGVFETCDLFNFCDTIREYISVYAQWTTDLNNKLNNDDLKEEEGNQIRKFLSELQFLDLVKLKTKLPDGSSSEALLLSPLHPLRLSWWLQQYEVFNDWEEKTSEFSGYIESWSKNLDNLFEGGLSPENNPLVLVELSSNKNYHYTGELSFGWGLYLNILNDESKNGMTSISRQLMHYFRQQLNVSKDNYVETELSQKLVVRHIKNYLSQHPYADKLIINLINSGDASVFADSFVELEKDHAYRDVKYEVRIFKGSDKIIEHGEGLKTLLNPDSNISEEAEAFSQSSKNRLFPKLRFSINQLQDYLSSPSSFTAHLSFLISPFPLTIELVRPDSMNRNFYLNGLITDSTVRVDENGGEIKWNRIIQPNTLPVPYLGTGEKGVKLFENLQAFTAGVLASKTTTSLPSTQLRLNDKDKVLLAHLHDYSDWVITFDKNLGPQIYDQPSKDGKIPFLLDYVPGEEVSGISSYLTTRPTSEILGLLGPHFEEFGLNIYEPEDEKRVKILLEDLRAVSSSLVLQLNSSKNKAFEVIGSAFTKRVLEKKGLLNQAFLIPIDLHQNLFENLPSGSKSRADNLLVSLKPEKKEIIISVIEIKCRKSLTEPESAELKIKMQEQIENTIQALRLHFDPEYGLSYDRLDREIKNKEFKSLLSFYIDRAYRYGYLSDSAYESFLSFLQFLDDGYKLKFKQLGLIFNFSAEKKHKKETVNNDLTFFTFGGNLVNEILDPDSDLNTRRLEDKEFEIELSNATGIDNSLIPFLKKVESIQLDSKPNSIEIPVQKKSKLAQIAKELNVSVKEVKEELSSLGIIVESNPNASISSQDYKIIIGHFESKITSTNKADNSEVDKPSSDYPSPKESKSVEEPMHTVGRSDYEEPDYDILIGKSSPSDQFGILAESIRGKKIGMDLSETNTISLFGVQGGGKSYTIGTISEMVLKQFSNINKLPSPLAGVIFHYSESMDYSPEFTSMIYPNDNQGELAKLKEVYGAEPDNIEDVILLTPQDKLDERKAEYPSIEVKPIAFNSKELNVQDWMFLLGAIGNDSAYIKQLKAIMRDHRRNITIDGITESVEASELLSNAQKSLAKQKLSFAREYIDDNYTLRDSLKPGRLIIVDLRDEFIVKDEALGLFVIMLNIFSAVKNIEGNHFNKFIVFDEAHKYMDNKDLTGNIVTAIREMRHKGVSIMIASQDPPSLPNEIIELSSVVLLHKFNSPQWLKHIQKSITQLSSLTAADMSALTPGEGFLWATKATESSITTKPIKVSTRPRVTKHGGETIKATGE